LKRAPVAQTPQRLTPVDRQWMSTVRYSRWNVTKQAEETFENRALAFIALWRLAVEHFEKSCYGNKLGFVCAVCDRIWFQNDLIRSHAAMLQFLRQDEDVQQFMLCSNRWTSLKQGEVTTLSNPPKPTHLPRLDPLRERLISATTVYAAQTSSL
jgi:hypothetical protein